MSNPKPPSSDPDALLRQALAHHQAGRLHEARRDYLAVLALAPSHPVASHYLGLLLCQAGSTDEGLDLLEKSVQAAPDVPAFRTNLGEIYRRMGQPDRALPHLQAAVELAPASALARNNLGGALQDAGHPADAVTQFDAAARLAPQDPIILENLATALSDVGRVTQAAQACRSLAQVSPPARPLVFEATLLPPVYESAQQVLALRQRLEAELDRLWQQGARVDVSDRPGRHAFLLAYQGFDDRAAMQRLASLHAAPPAPPPTAGSGRPRGPGVPRRVGFISRFFLNHTIGVLNRGLITHLPRQGLEVFALSLGDHRDQTAQAIRAGADHFVVVPLHLPAARQAIVDLDLDVLIYCDIGMEPITWTLAMTRLAPVQCVTWGHPPTTGLHTIDYYLSSTLIETPAAQQHYTERLALLDALAVYYERPDTSASALRRAEDFGLPAGQGLYGCLQSTFKLHPDQDALFAGILRADPRGALVLLRPPHSPWEDALRARFRASMPDVCNRIHFVPPLSRPDFLALTGLCDVLLDTLHFGGGNTAYEAAAAGVPLITLPSAFLKGRLSQAIARTMAYQRCVVADPLHYVALAVQLANDADARREVRRALADHSPRLFSNPAGPEALARFLRELPTSR